MRFSIIFLFIIFSFGNYHSQTWINEVTITPFPIKECDSVFVIIDGNMSATNCSPTFSYTIELNEIIVDVNITCPGIGGPAITPYEETIALGLLLSNDYTLIINQYLDSDLQETNTSYFTVENCCDSISATIEQIGNSIELTNIQNATLPYTILWNTGENTQSITPNYNGLFWAVVTDSNNCFSDTLKFIVDFVEINGLVNKTKGVSIFPNPTKNYITISHNHFKGETQTTIFDLFGNKLFTTTENLIDLGSFSKGIYTFKITIGNFSSVYNVVKN